ncbi:MAG: menaquinone biosynthesis protein [Syntrophobacterales bacterium]|nr:menaquinone biosynthesis protein [Syntrophobacterales bacterium]
MKLGYIDYLNCYPFYYQMFEGAPPAGVEVVPGYPSELNRMMAEEKLDMSPVSAAMYPELADRVLLLPDFCLSSVGYVHSVILSSNMPIEDLDKKRIGLTSASKTSVIILKILLSRYYRIEPRYVPTAPNPSLKDAGVDAALIIGNEAMMGEMAPYTYDLGDLWMRKTNHPVVFAVFAVNKRLLEKNSAVVAAVVESYRKSLVLLAEKRETVIRRAAERYPLVHYDIDAYYRVLKYNFTPSLREAFSFYLQSAAEMGLLKKTAGEAFLGPLKE